jgi:hypothetical protein
MVNPNPKPKSTAAERHERAQHIVARRLDGRSLSEIAVAEGLSVRRVQQIAAEEIARRDADPSDDYTLLQIARLERALEMLGRQIDDGKASAVPAFVKVVEQLGALTKWTFHLSREAMSRERVEMDARFARLDVAREIVAERRTAPAGRGRAQVLENKHNSETPDFAAQ